MSSIDHADLELRHVDRRDQRGELELAQVDDGDDRRVERDLLARLHVPLRDDAGERRDDRRILDRVLREPHLRLDRLQAALRDAVARFAAVERVLRDELLRQELVVHRPRLLRERELRLRAFQRTRCARRASLRGRRCRSARAAGRP